MPANNITFVLINHTWWYVLSVVVQAEELKSTVKKKPTRKNTKWCQKYQIVDAIVYHICTLKGCSYQLLIVLSFERPYLIKGQKLMILHADFAAENCRLWLKTVDYGKKPWILVKNCGFWSKTMDYGQKLRIMVKNHGLWSKTMDFGWKPHISVENHGFRSFWVWNYKIVY